MLSNYLLECYSMQNCYIFNIRQISGCRHALKSGKVFFSLKQMLQNGFLLPETWGAGIYTFKIYSYLRARYGDGYIFMPLNSIMAEVQANLKYTIYDYYYSRPRFLGMGRSAEGKMSKPEGGGGAS